MKAALEKINPNFGNSFTVRKFLGHAISSRPSWHFHPEYEIVYISRGSGKRHIGNHISNYENGDLIFLGPNIPHFGFVDSVNEAMQIEVVVQMKEDFLGNEFLDRPEMINIKQLLERAKQGLSFTGKIKEQIGEELERLVDKDNFKRLLGLLNILEELALSEDYVLLNAERIALEVNAQEQLRMRSIYDYAIQNFRKNIPLIEIAREVNMTVPAFCRYFKKLTGKTFTSFVNEYRIAHACKLLSGEPLSISEVCFESGFNNFSHFNKQFKEFTGKSPSEYRKEKRSLVL